MFRGFWWRSLGSPPKPLIDLRPIGLVAMAATIQVGGVLLVRCVLVLGSLRRWGALLLQPM